MYGAYNAIKRVKDFTIEAFGAVYNTPAKQGYCISTKFDEKQGVKDQWWGADFVPKQGTSKGWLVKEIFILNSSWDKHKLSGAKVYINSSNNKVIPMYTRGIYGDISNEHGAKAIMNDLIASIIKSGEPLIIMRECPKCEDSHKLIYYKRMTVPPATIDFYELFIKKW